MREIYLCLLLVLFFIYARCDEFQHTLGHIKTRTNSKTQAEAAFDTIKRIIPERASEFAIVISPDFAPEGKDLYQVVKQDGIIKIIGSTGVAALTGFHYYLKYYCFAHISWEASQLSLPKTLPEVNITTVLNDRFRYYQNVCTTSYSFVWWNWTQWEKHIDWMALNSFNLVLAFNGQEAIWKRVYTKLNLTEDDINEHFTGPAFLSWLRMGNMRGFGGPLSEAWHERSLTLQKQILSRMRSLGIITVLPAFAGHLPKAFKRIYPDVNMTVMDRWNGFNDSFCCPYFLDPTEKFFSTVGKMFLEEQIAEFGTDHVYNCDSFNEIDPPFSDLTYLSNVGKSIYGAMLEADSQAIWLMQGWLFVNSFLFWSRSRVKALVTSVPNGKMIILDLQSEEFPQYDRLEQYFGQPYIWCMLHDFGGTLGMFGSSSIINENVIKARNRNGSTMIGTGLTPEGINQNYVIYDLMTESAWRTEPVDLYDWVKNYTIRRYGKRNENIFQAWKKLTGTVYDFKSLMRMRGRYSINVTPSLKLYPWTWYSYGDLFNCWNVFIGAADDFRDSPAFLHDLVDITRQVLQVNGDIYYQDLINAFNGEALEIFEPIANTFMSIFPDLEMILATSPDFLLGRWIESAKACANDSEEEKQFEYNARNQISLWGPNGEIINYANKQWSGVVSHYFQPRWYLFIEYMKLTLQYNGTFNETYIRQQMFINAEEPFTFDRTVFPTEPTGDAVEVAKDIHNRWAEKIANYRKYKHLNLPKDVRRKQSNINKNRSERSSEESEENFAYNHYYIEEPRVIVY